MIRFIQTVDALVKKTLTAFCAVFLLLMVVFAVYNVVMRYVFENPPVWGGFVNGVEQHLVGVSSVGFNRNIFSRYRHDRLRDRNGYHNGRQVLGNVVLRLGRRAVCVQA